MKGKKVETVFAGVIDDFNLECEECVWGAIGNLHKKYHGVIGRLIIP